jgi:hypothetical protein
MAHPAALIAVRADHPRQGWIRELLYKTDHPRRIDSYIDFFGDRTGLRESDPCGDRLLGSLA